MATETAHINICETFLELVFELSGKLSCLCFEQPVSYVYNPLEYACDPHCNYVRKYCQTTKKVLFVGMNPGPFGMAQNGVPFGDPHYAKNWLEITGDISKPAKECPNRPILGWDSTRTEVSGARFWGFMKKYSITPENFFSNCFVYNYCPLVFMNETGKNITPNNIPAYQRKELFSLCDSALRMIVRLLEVETLVCIGKFVESRCHKMCTTGLDGNIVGLMHPSPANPKANTDWENIALKQLLDSSVMQYVSNDLGLHRLCHGKAQLAKTSNLC